MEKIEYTISIDAVGHITEKKHTVFYDDNGKEIARSKPWTRTIDPGDPTQQLATAGERTKAIAAVVHTPELVAEFKAKKAEKE